MEKLFHRLMEKRSLATAFSNRYIMALALPLMAELFLGVLIGFADTVMVSSCGQSAVSGVSLVDTLSQLVIQVLSAFATAGSVVAAQYLGRGEASKASEASRQLIVASFAASSVMVAACILLREPIIDMVFGSIEPSVREASCTYFVWIFLSYPFLAVFNCCTATFRAMGNGSLQLKVSLLTNVLNIAGNALLIYVFNLGVAGAAISSLFSRIVGMAIMLVSLGKKDNPIHIDSLARAKGEQAHLGRILRIAVPSAIETSFFHIGKISVQSIVSSLGTVAIAANAVTVSITSITCVPGSAMSLAAISIIGNLRGSNKIDEIKPMSRKLYLIAEAVMAAVSAIVFILRRPMFGLFSISSEARAMALGIMNVYLIAQVGLWCLSFVVPNFMKACGDARFLMVIGICSMWLARVLAAKVFVYLGLGLQGVWLGMYLDWLVRSICFLARFSTDRWLKKEVI